MKYKWLLLDIDNTLLDFTTAAHKALETSLADFNIELNSELHARYKKANHLTWSEFEQGKTSALTLRALRFERFFNDANIQGIDPSIFSKLFLENLVIKSKAYDGIIDLLDTLRQDYTLSIITNGLKEVQRPRLERLGMTNLFKSIVVSDEINTAKPSPAFFEYTWSSVQHKFNKSEALVVGDNLHSDIIGGNNYGFDTCWISHERTNETDIGPTYTISSFLEINSVLNMN